MDLIPRDELLKQNARLEEVRDEIIAELMKYPGVIAVSDGVKRVGGSLVPEICIKVTVEKKRDLKDIPESERIPAEIKGFKTDVEERPEAELSADQKTYRPIVGGSCIGTTLNSGEGTLGCFANVNAGAPAHAGDLVLLSNFHVLCNTAGTVAGDARVGQPSHNGCCSCCACDEIGQVIDGEVSNANMDCAIARVFLGGDDPKDIRFLDSAIIDIGYIAGSGPILTPPNYSVLAGETVFKRGRTTELTIGTVSNRGAVTGAIKYNENPLITYVKSDVIEVTPTAPFVDFSQKGDSGSALVNVKNEVVGLHFAGNPAIHRSFSCHINYVITRLNITIRSSVTETGLPIASVIDSFDTLSNSSMEKWMTEAEELLVQTYAGKKIRNLIYKHHKEVKDLIRKNKEVRVAWIRYSGPGFTNHVARSIRDDHAIPFEVKGVTFESLLLKMSAVLMRHGSESLIDDLEKNYLDLLEIASAGNRFKHWLEKLESISNAYSEPLTSNL